MRTFLYARVSDLAQTLEHQRAQAEAAGFKIDEVIADHGVSGVTTKLADRPGGRRLLDKVRAGDQVIVRWVDRLGRNYDDATATIRHLMNEGVVVKTVINMMVFDGSTTDPIQKAVRDAMIAFMAATAQAQAEATKAAQKAGIAHAKQQAEAKYRGRKPSYSRAQFDIVQAMLNQHQGISAIAKATDLSRQTIYRIEQRPGGGAGGAGNLGSVMGGGGMAKARSATILKKGPNKTVDDEMALDGFGRGPMSVVSGNWTNDKSQPDSRSPYLLDTLPAGRGPGVCGYA